MTLHVNDTRIMPQHSGTLLHQATLNSYFIAVAVVVIAYFLFCFGEYSSTCSSPSDTLSGWNFTAKIMPQQKSILRPDIFQEFELQEKSIISHNVAR